MTLLVTIAAIIAFIIIPLAIYLAAWIAIRIARDIRDTIRLAKHFRHTRNNAESDAAELCGFFIVPEAINSIHDGDK